MVDLAKIHDCAMTKVHFMCSVGHIEAEIVLDTVPISPYFSNKWFKWLLELLFVIFLFHQTASVATMVCAEKRTMGERLKESEQSLETLSPMQPKSTWLRSILRHFVTGNTPISNCFDVAIIIVGFTVCVTWVLLTQNARIAESSMIALRRPDGDVAYDDTDSDSWSLFHHDITHVETHIEKIIQDMVS
jgi:hypothetical protein